MIPSKSKKHDSYINKKRYVYKVTDDIFCHGVRDSCHYTGKYRDLVYVYALKNKSQPNRFL